jgi:2-isopropylmalate synthase
VGVPESKLVLGKHSGRHALAKRCEDLGCPLTRDQLDVMYTRFTALADRKKGLRNDEIAELAQGVLADTKPSGVAVS